VVSTAPPRRLPQRRHRYCPRPWPGIVTDAHADSYPSRIGTDLRQPLRGRATGHQALALAAKIGEMAEKGAVLRILAQIAVTDIERPEPARLKASRLFTEALEVYEEINARFERAETMVLMASLDLGPARWKLLIYFEPMNYTGVWGSTPSTRKPRR